MAKSSIGFLEARVIAQLSNKFMKKLAAAERQLDALLVAPSKVGCRPSRQAERVFDVLSRLRDEAIAFDARYGVLLERPVPKPGGKYRALVQAERRAGL